MSETFDVVLTDKLVPGKDRDEVLEALARLFKIDEGKVERILAAGHFVVKRKVEHVVALKYQATLRQAGVFALVKPADMPIPRNIPDTNTTESAASSDGPTGEDATANATGDKIQDDAPSPDTASAVSAPEFSTALGIGDALPPREAPPAVHIPNFEVDPPGTELLKGISRPAPPPPPVTDHLSLAEPGERLTEPRPVAHKDIPLEGLSLAPPGEPLTEDQPRPAAPEVDISHLSIKTEQ
jgi:hypothetical protein